MARFLNVWRNLLRRDRVEQDLDDEVRAALDILTEEKVTARMTPQEARRAAAIELGGVESVKEQVRDVRSGAFLETFLQDLRYAARLLRRQPLFTATAALSLAIGIGATRAPANCCRDRHCRCLGHLSRFSQGQRRCSRSSV